MRQPPRIVRQQDGVRSDSLEHLSQMRHSAGPIADADDIEQLAADGQTCVLIFEDGEVMFCQRRRHVTVVVVNAEHREGPMWRVGQRGEQLGDRLDIGAVAISDVVAPEHDQVWGGGTQQLHRARDIVRRDRRAVVDIGNEADTEAIERVRQA